MSRAANLKMGYVKRKGSKRRSATLSKSGYKHLKKVVHGGKRPHNTANGDRQTSVGPTVVHGFQQTRPTRYHRAPKMLQARTASTRCLSPLRPRDRDADIIPGDWGNRLVDISSLANLLTECVNEHNSSHAACIKICNVVDFVLVQQ